MTPIIEAVRRHNKQYRLGCVLVPSLDDRVIVRTRDDIEICRGTEGFCTAYMNKLLPEDQRVPVDDGAYRDLLVLYDQLTKSVDEAIANGEKILDRAQQVNDLLRAELRAARSMAEEYENEASDLRRQLAVANKQIADMEPVAASRPDKDDLADALSSLLSEMGDFYISVCSDGSGSIVAETQALQNVFYNNKQVIWWNNMEISDAIREELEKRKVTRDQATAAIGSGDLDTLQKWIDQQREAGK